MAIGKLRKAARIILVGPPGCGKGTQSGRLLDHFKLTPISSGDLLRQNVRAPPSTPHARNNYSYWGVFFFILAGFMVITSLSDCANGVTPGAC